MRWWHLEGTQAKSTPAKPPRRPRQPRSSPAARKRLLLQCRGSLVINALVTYDADVDGHVRRSEFEKAMWLIDPKAELDTIRDIFAEIRGAAPTVAILTAPDALKALLLPLTSARTAQRLHHVDPPAGGALQMHANLHAAQASAGGQAAMEGQPSLSGAGSGCTGGGRCTGLSCSPTRLERDPVTRDPVGGLRMSSSLTLRRHALRLEQSRGRLVRLLAEADVAGTGGVSRTVFRNALPQASTWHYSVWHYPVWHYSAWHYSVWHRY